MGGPRNDAGWYSFQSYDGNFLMIGERPLSGNIPQTYLVKFDRKGTILWEKFYGDSLNSNYAYSCAEEPDGNLFIASNWGIPILMKTDKFGNILWQKKFGNPIDQFGGIKLIDNNTKLLIKSSNIINNLNTVGLIKIDTNGSIIWTKTYTDTALYESSYNSFYATKDAYFIAGRKILGLNLYPTILKIDTNGVLVWEKVFPHMGQFECIIQISENSLIAAGYDGTTGASGMYCSKIEKNGIIDWIRTYSNDTISSGFSIEKGATNKIVITGIGEDAKGKLMFIDTMGNVISIITHYYEPNDYIVYRSISICDDLGFIISGYIEFNEIGNNDCLIVKTDMFGNTIPIGIINNQEFANYLSIKSYPNPFNSNSTIEIKTLINSNITLKLFNINGKEISNLFSGIVNNGLLHVNVSFDKLNLASGIYFIVVDLIKNDSHKLFSNKLIYLK